MDDLKLYGRSQAEVESLVHTANIYFDDIGMEIGAAKCSVVAIVKGHLAEVKDIVLSSGDLIAHLSPCGAYRYLGILEADNFKHQQVKDLLSREYKCHVRKLLRSHLFSRNLFTALNTCAASLMTYSGGIIEWTQEELRRLDICTRKLLTMHGVFSTNSDVNRLYIPRRNGGRGLISVLFSVEHEKRNLSMFMC